MASAAAQLCKQKSDLPSCVNTDPGLLTGEKRPGWRAQGTPLAQAQALPFLLHRRPWGALGWFWSCLPQQLRSAGRAAPLPRLHMVALGRTWGEGAAARSCLYVKRKGALLAKTPQSKRLPSPLPPQPLLLQAQHCAGSQEERRVFPDLFMLCCGFMVFAGPLLRPKCSQVMLGQFAPASHLGPPSGIAPYLSLSVLFPLLLADPGAWNSTGYICPVAHG